MGISTSRYEFPYVSAVLAARMPSRVNTRGILHRDPPGFKPVTVRAQTLRADNGPCPACIWRIVPPPCRVWSLLRPAERGTKAGALRRRQSSRTSHLPNPRNLAVTDERWLTLRCEISHFQAVACQELAFFHLGAGVRPFQLPLHTSCCNGAQRCSHPAC